MVSSMKLGELTRCRLASQKSGLISKNRRRMAARAVPPRLRKNLKTFRRCHDCARRGRSRQTYLSRHVTNASQEKEMPATDASEPQ